MMKTNGNSLLIGLMILFLFAACQSTGPGPKAWIDQPLNSSEFTAGPITIQAHASDPDGVTAIAFFVMEEKVGEQQVNGERLENASILWQPPAPGKYQLSARGIDNAGNPGELAKIEIEVNGEPLATQTPTPKANIKDEVCSEAEVKAPILLSPENGAAIQGQPTLTWSYPDGTCHPASYVIDISPDATFKDISLGFGTADYNETSRAWPLPAGACYFWRVRALLQGADGPNSSVGNFCIAPIEVLVKVPSISVDQNANCRSGPGTNYETTAQASKGSELEILGRNPENTWFWVKPSESTIQCWISSSIGTLNGDPLKAPITKVAAQPVISPTPTPTPTPASPMFLVIPAVIDTTPPVISSIEFIPPIIAASGPVLCPGYVDVDIWVSASDNSGFVDVYAEIPSTGLMTWLRPTGSHFEQAVSPGSIPGTIQVIIHAYDEAGNHATAEASFIVIPCTQ